MDYWLSYQANLQGVCEGCNYPELSTLINQELHLCMGDNVEGMDRLIHSDEPCQFIAADWGAKMISSSKDHLRTECII